MIDKLARTKVARFVLSVVAKKMCGEDKECVRQLKEEAAWQTSLLAGCCQGCPPQLRPPA